MSVTITMPDSRVAWLMPELWAKVRAPYEARDTIKTTIPASYRRWIGTAKVWEVEPTYVPTLTAALQASGFTVTVSGAPTTSASPDWVVSAYADCSDPAQVERLRGGLLRAFHPDLGSDPALIRRIVDNADDRRRELR